MADSYYQQARRLGLKEYRARLAQEEDPYLPALDELLPEPGYGKEMELGLMNISIEQIVGTRSVARREAFSPSFYPLLEENSEFAAKWTSLANSHLQEGIRDPIKAIEYLNRFYVIEGHKRVSVLSFFGAVSIQAEVRRLLPPRSDDPEIAVYYEFLDFYKVTRINTVVFHKLGSYPKFLKLLCGEDLSPWDEDRRRAFFADVVRFREALAATQSTGTMSRDEALLRYVEIFGAETLGSRTPNELKADMAAILPELNSVKNESEPVLVTDAVETQPRSLLSRIVRPGVKSLRVAFLHDKDPESSFWTYAHEQGRLKAQEALGDRVETESCFHMLEKDFDATIRELADRGVDMVFSTTPRLLAPSVSAAAAWPEIRFLNCSVNVSHPILRCYYARMYEAKFLTGVVAGALSENGSVGFVCDYPVYSSAASINAFALGAKMVNPRARVLLEWSTVRGAEIDERFARFSVTAVSGQDSLLRDERKGRLGLFLCQGGRNVHVASSYWNWGAFYQKIMESVLDGTWEALKSTSEAGATINYWWGLSTGAVDIRLGEGVPTQTARLVRLLRQEIAEGRFRPFDGPILDQEGKLRIAEGEILSPQQILHMNWLAENVEGQIPSFEQLTQQAQELVKIQGVEKE